MAIPASELVNIQPRVLGGTGTDLVFNGAFITNNVLAPVDTLLTFRSADAVADYFGYESKEYSMATVYFNGFDNSTLKPSTAFFYRHTAEATAPYLRGAKSENEADLLSALKAVGSGTLTITLGTEQTIQNINFGEAVSLSECAQILQTAIQGVSGGDAAFTSATVTYSSVAKAFTITAGTTGEQVAISYATGDVAEQMLLTEEAFAILSQGANAATYTETLDNLSNQTMNFVTYTTIEGVSDTDDAKALAQWSNSQFNAGNQFLYVWHTDDVGLTKGVGTNDALTAITGNVGCCAAFKDSKAAFIMGIAGSINWDAANSTLTFAYKSQSGLEFDVNDKPSADNLIANKVNFYGNYATRNDNFIFLQNGCMLDDNWKWIDTFLNSCWLNNALQVQILSGMQLTLRAPYGEVGYAMVNSWVSDVADRAKNNGVIDTGVNLSNTQITQLTREAGRDISTDLYNNGYVFQILEPTAQIRQNRESPSANFWYTYAGAIHKLNIPSTAVV